MFVYLIILLSNKPCCENRKTNASSRRHRREKNRNAHFLSGSRIIGVESTSRVYKKIYCSIVLIIISIIINYDLLGVKNNFWMTQNTLYLLRAYEMYLFIFSLNTYIINLLLHLKKVIHYNYKFIIYNKLIYVFTIFLKNNNNKSTAV